ncbi:hypothetical protein ACWIVU_11045, partial [Ursidibacter arcticus]
MNTLNTQLDPLRKNGEQDRYIDFFDLLLNLDWRSGKNDELLATDLKTAIDTKFNNEFDNYTTEPYQEIIKLYKKREGQIAGSEERLKKELHDIKYNVNSGYLNGLRSQQRQEKGYQDSLNLETPAFEEFFVGADGNTYPSTVETYFTKENNYIKKLYSKELQGELLGVSQFSAYVKNKHSFTPYDNVEKNENTFILLKSSIKKAKDNHKFNALLDFESSTQYGKDDNGRIYTQDIYFKKDN